MKVLVTAGGTWEPIDPVRFLSNWSSSKQGHAVAEEAAARGANVTLVTTVDRSAPLEPRSSGSTPPPRWPTPCWLLPAAPTSW